MSVSCLVKAPNTAGQQGWIQNIKRENEHARHAIFGSWKGGRVGGNEGGRMRPGGGRK